MAFARKRTRAPGRELNIALRRRLRAIVLRLRKFRSRAIPSSLGFLWKYSVDSAPSELCFGAFYESRFLHQVGQEASPGVPGGSP